MKTISKLSVLCLVYLLIAVLSSCTTQPNSTSHVEINPDEESNVSKGTRDGPKIVYTKPSTPYEAFEGIEWGMTKQELIKALGIQEADLQKGNEQEALGKEGWSHWEDPKAPYYIRQEAQVLGVNADLVLFYMDNASMYETGTHDPNAEERLSQILVFYQKPDDQVKTAVQSSLDQVYQHTGARIRVTGNPAKLERKEGERTSYWYSQETLDTQLTPQGDEILREILIEKAHQEEWEEDGNWELFKEYGYLTEVSLWDDEEAYFNAPDIPGRPYILVTLKGEMAAEAKLVNQRGAA